MARNWYLLTVFSGDENKVKVLIEKTVCDLRIEDRIRRIVVPTICERVERSGRLVDKRRKLFPGQIAVEIDHLDDDIYWLLTQTVGVQGFSCGGNRPQPLRGEELDSLVSQDVIRIETCRTLQKGEMVRIKEGPLGGLSGPVEELASHEAYIQAEIFGTSRRVKVEISNLELI